MPTKRGPEKLTIPAKRTPLQAATSLLLVEIQAKPDQNPIKTR
jgi:hypothetical protein